MDKADRVHMWRPYGWRRWALMKICDLYYIPRYYLIDQRRLDRTYADHLAAAARDPDER